MHHLLVERLEKLYEPIFIHDSFANRRGKGSHAAVDRLQHFMRARESMPCAGGWYLQLDIHNYFNSIHRPTLYRMLCQRLELALRRQQLTTEHALALRSLCHRLLARRTPELVRDPRAAAKVPAHKRLCNAAPGCGLPVGNLTSQFFANVYLNALDQFVKHTLKVRHYLRYVDDFVLLTQSPEQLEQWHAQIREFLHDALRLSLKDVARLQALVGSYWGQFSHASATRLCFKLLARHPWLGGLFDAAADARLTPSAPARWLVRRHRAVRQILQPEGASTWDQ